MLCVSTLTPAEKKMKTPRGRERSMRTSWNKEPENPTDRRTGIPGTKTAVTDAQIMSQRQK